MARRLDDRHGLAKVLVRSYWSRDERDSRRRSTCSPRRATSAHELGDDELEADAREWRVAGAHRDRRPRPRDESTARCSLIAAPAAPAVPDARRRALRAHARAVRRPARRGGGGRAPLPRVGRLLTGRAPSGIYGIQMFSIRREQGRLDELAPSMRLLAGGDAPGGAWRPGLAALLAELGIEAEARRELDAHPRPTGFDALRAVALAGVAHLPRRRRAPPWRRAARRRCSTRSSRRSPARNVVIGHGVACYGAADRYLGLLAATLGEHDLAADHFEAALRSTADGRADVGRAHAPTRTAGRCARGRGRDVGSAAALLSEAATLAERIGLPMVLRRARELGGDAARRVALPDEPLLARGRRPAARRHGASATGRSARSCSSAATPWPTTCAASCARPAAANRTEAAGYAYRHALLDPGDAR